MTPHLHHTLLSIVAATAVLCSAAAQAAPMAEEPPAAANQAQLLASTVTHLEQNCGVQPYCGADEPLIVSVLQSWERDVRLKLADLVAVRFGFSLPEQHDQLSAPTDDWAPAFFSDYQQVTLSPAHSIEVRRQRYEPGR